MVHKGSMQSPRIPRAKQRELSVKAGVDPRTIVAVLADPTNLRTMARQRAFVVLADAGLLPQTAA